MKKIFSLLLIGVMALYMIPTAIAANTNPASQGTTIIATGTRSTAYEVTVPAALTIGQSGTVTANGTWAASQTLKVTAPTSVDLVNGSDKMSVGIEFAGIEEVGNNNGDTVNASATVTVDTIDTSTFFGTWTGTLNYTVEMVNIIVPGATFSDGATLSWDELKLENNGMKYGYDASAISDIEIGSSAFSGCPFIESITLPDGLATIGDHTFDSCTSLTSITLPDSITTICEQAFFWCTSLESITFRGTTAQWNGITFGDYWNDDMPATEVTCSDSTVSLRPTIITFTIDGTSYQAEEGMTWAQWVDSDYNTVGLVINGDFIRNSKNWFVGYSSATTIARPTDIIYSTISDYTTMPSLG